VHHAQSDDSMTRSQMVATIIGSKPPATAVLGSGIQSCAGPTACGDDKKRPPLEAQQFNLLACDLARIHSLPLAPVCALWY
jgi:hypothetical protein